MSKCTICSESCNKTTKRFKGCALRVRTNYDHFCKEYIRLFCDKHGFDYGQAISDTHDYDLVCVGDLFFSLTDIRVDIDNDAPKHELMAWYDYYIETCCLGVNPINYDSWLKGCPRISEDGLEKLRELKKNAADAEQILIDEIERMNVIR